MGVQPPGSHPEALSACSCRNRPFRSCAVFGLPYESVSKFWGDQDSPVWIYVVYGAVAFALALVCFWAAVTHSAVAKACDDALVG